MRIVLATILCLAPALAQAEGFVTTDLGESDSLDACMFRAQRSLNIMTMEPQNAGSTVYSGPWSVAVYGMQPGNVALTIVCPTRDDRVPVALVMAHSEGPESDRSNAVNFVVERWNATGQSGDVRDQGQPSK